MTVDLAHEELLSSETPVKRKSAYVQAKDNERALARMEAWNEDSKAFRKELSVCFS